MKILHLCASDFEGGAATAARNLDNALKTQGERSVRKCFRRRDGKFSILLSRMINRCERMVLQFLGDPHAYKALKPGIFGIGIRRAQLKNFDAVVIYWANSGFLSTRQIRVITEYAYSNGIPVFWRLSDMWPITGGCHYSSSCDQFMSGCSDCPLVTTTAAKRLISNQNKIKREEISKYVTYLCPTSWTKSLVERAIPEANALYFPTGISIPDPPVRRHGTLLTLVIGAVRLFSDPRKGFAETLMLVEHLRTHFPADRLRIVLFGESLSEQHGGVARKLDELSIECLGEIRDPQRLQDVYRQSDVMLATYVEDNLPNIFLEAMAHGVVIIARRVGGCGDVLSDENSIALKNNAKEEVVAAISRLLMEEGYLETMRKNAYSQIRANHDITESARHLRTLIRESQQ